MKLSVKQSRALGYLEDSSTMELLYGGAAGGGKTVLGCVWQILRRTKYPDTTGLIGRQTRKDIYSTVIRTFNWVAKLLGAGVKWFYKINEHKDEIQFDNGSIIFLRDMAYKPSDPMYDRLKLELTDAWIEEATQVPQKAVELLKSRIRHKLVEFGLIATLLLTSNPAHCWVKYEYVKDKAGNRIELPIEKKFIQALVDDNPDKEFVESYKRTLNYLDPVTKEMYLHGNWDVQLNENPFFPAFSREKHFTNDPYKLIQNLYIDISFDFNVNPTTLIVGQYNNSNHSSHVFDLFLANQKTMPGLSSLEAVCTRFKNKYIDTGIILPYLIRVTGDASGSNSNADRAEKQTFYSTIIRILGINENQIHIRDQNLEHIMSGSLINNALRLIPKGHTVIHGLLELISEIELTFPDSEGKLNKAKKDHGLHILDAWRYLMDLWYSGNYYNNIDEITQNIINISNLIIHVNNQRAA